MKDIAAYLPSVGLPIGNDLIAASQRRTSSIQGRLKNKALTTGTKFQQILLLFFQEEFLRRVSKS
jgi:hypothetical protein